jgi:type IV secretion system protein VirD4
MVRVIRLRLYQPTAFFWWWFAYDAYARNILVEDAYIAALGGFAAIVTAIGMSVWPATASLTPRSTHTCP